MRQQIEAHRKHAEKFVEEQQRKLAQEKAVLDNAPASRTTIREMEKRIAELEAQRLREQQERNAALEARLKELEQNK